MKKSREIPALVVRSGTGSYAANLQELDEVRQRSVHTHPGVFFPAHLNRPVKRLYTVHRRKPFRLPFSFTLRVKLFVLLVAVHPPSFLALPALNPQPNCRI